MASKTKVWWISGIVVFVICALVAWHFLKKDLANPKGKIIKPLITDQIKKFVIKASDSLYHFKYSRFDLNIDSGRGLITNLNLTADTAVYKRLLAAKKAPNNVLSIHIDSLMISDFGFIKTDSGRRFNIDGVTAKNCYVTMSNKRQAYNDSTTNSKGLLRELLKDLMRMTTVKRSTFNNITFVYINKNDGQVRRTVFKRWNVSMSDFSIANFDERKDSTKKANSELIKVGTCTISTPDSLYRLIFSDMRVLPQERSAYVARFVLKPRLNKTAFYRQSGFNRDRLYFIYNKISVKGIDIERLINRQQIHIDKVTAANSWHEVFNNYHWPNRLRPVRKYSYPHERLQLVAFDVTIDTIKMHNGYFQYTIAAKKSKQTAKLFMTDMESTIYNVTNNKMQIEKKPYTLCYSTNRMMGAGYTTAKYKFNLASKSGAFSATIHMGSMNAKAMDPVSAPLGLMSVKSGTIDKMNMYVYATEKAAKGNIDIYYHDLKINLLKRDDKADTLKKRGFLSFMTNAVMPNDNPRKNGKFSKGPINVAHDRRTSFLGLMWKCAQDGMSSAMMGIDQKKDKPDENIVIKAVENVFKPLQRKKQLKKDQQ